MTRQNEEGQQQQGQCPNRDERDKPHGQLDSQHVTGRDRQ